MRAPLVTRAALASGLVLLVCAVPALEAAHGYEYYVVGNPADVVELPANLVTEVVKLWYEERKIDAPDLEERIDWWLEEGGDECVLHFFHSRVSCVPHTIIFACDSIVSSHSTYPTSSPLPSSPSHDSFSLRRRNGRRRARRASRRSRRWIR